MGSEMCIRDRRNACSCIPTGTREDADSAVLGRIPLYSLYSSPLYSRGALRTLHKTVSPPRGWRTLHVGWAYYHAAQMLVRDLGKGTRALSPCEEGGPRSRMRGVLCGVQPALLQRARAPLPPAHSPGVRTLQWPRCTLRDLETSRERERGGRTPPRPKSRVGCHLWRATCIRSPSYSRGALKPLHSARVDPRRLWC